MGHGGESEWREEADTREENVKSGFGCCFGEEDTCSRISTKQLVRAYCCPAEFSKGIPCRFSCSNNPRTRVLRITEIAPCTITALSTKSPVTESDSRRIPKNVLYKNEK